MYVLAVTTDHAYLRVWVSRSALCSVKYISWNIQTVLLCFAYGRFLVDSSDFFINILQDGSEQHVDAEIKWPPFTRGHFQMHFLEWKCVNLIKFSLNFVPKGQVNNIPILVQIMAWHRSGDKPLSELMMVSLLTHICVTRPQWLKLCGISAKPTSSKSQQIQHLRVI